MAADYSRIHRLLKILTLIQGGDGWTSKRLAQECGTTERTIYRDLTMIQGAGIPYFYDEQRKCYAIRRDFFMPPVELTLEESLSLAALAEHIGGREQVPFTRAAAKAIAKIRGQLPPAIRKELDQIEAHVAIQLAAAASPESTEDVYNRVQKALSTKRALLCRYESVSGARKNGRNNGEFLLEPYALFFATRAWYVLGFHRGRGEVRCLKLNRFTRVQPTQVAYSIPRTFSLESHLGNAWRMIRGPRRYKIELVFDSQFADTIADTHWHKTQQVEWNSEDDSITYRCEVDGLDEIVWWVLGMGPHCRVIRPPELVDRVRTLASQTLQQYVAAAPAKRRRPTVRRAGA